jgi:hypothetical protein
MVRVRLGVVISFRIVESSSVTDTFPLYAGFDSLKGHSQFEKNNFEVF